VVGEHEYRGLWWVPGDGAEKLPGTLTVHKGEAALELIGTFGHQLLSEKATEKTYSHDLAERPRIVGMSTDGKPITLEGHRAAPHSMSFPGIPTSTYKRNVALIGKEFADGEEIGFDEISIRASDLNSWTRVSGFTHQIGMEKNEEKGFTVLSSVEIRFDAPDDIAIPLTRGESAFIRFDAPSKGIGGNSEHVSLTQQAAFHLRFGKRASLEQVFQRVGEIRNFFTLAVGRPVSILAVTGYQDDFVQSKTGSPRAVELLWEIPHNAEPPSDSRRPHEMLFSLRDATPDISTVMRNWFAKQVRLEPVFNLFFGTRHHPDLYLEVRFLSYAQALETYDYRRRRRPGNKPLAQRVRDVLDDCRTVSSRIVGAEAAERDAFIQIFKDSRNYYTHYNPKLEKKAAHDVALLLLSIQLQALIEMSLLRQLGFGCRSIANILERGRRFAEIAHFKRLIADEAQDG
jgi:hypothetical protein